MDYYVIQDGNVLACVRPHTELFHKLHLSQHLHSLVLPRIEVCNALYCDGPLATVAVGLGYGSEGTGSEYVCGQISSIFVNWVEIKSFVLGQEALWYSFEWPTLCIDCINVGMLLCTLDFDLFS